MITIYSTPNCKYCKGIKDYLGNRKIEFVEIDVSKDREKKEEMIEKSGQMGVPVTDYNGSIIIGFDLDKLEFAAQSTMSFEDDPQSDLICDSCQ